MTLGFALAISTPLQWAVSRALVRRALADPPDEPAGARLRRHPRAAPQGRGLVERRGVADRRARLRRRGLWLHVDRGSRSSWSTWWSAASRRCSLGSSSSCSSRTTCGHWRWRSWRAHPSAAPRGSGLFWPRQRWYLPYAFARRHRVAAGLRGDRGGDALDGSGLSRLLATVEARGHRRRRGARGELDGLLVSAGVPVPSSPSSCWSPSSSPAACSRGARRGPPRRWRPRCGPLAAGTPESPRWIATDETGDLAHAAARISLEMARVFAQLRAMAAGDLGRALVGDSGLVQAFRESRPPWWRWGSGWPSCPAARSAIRLAWPVISGRASTSCSGRSAPRRAGHHHRRRRSPPRRGDRPARSARPSSG